MKTKDEDTNVITNLNINMLINYNIYHVTSKSYNLYRSKIVYSKQRQGIHFYKGKKDYFNPHAI